MCGAEQLGSCQERLCEGCILSCLGLKTLSCYQDSQFLNDLGMRCLPLPRMGVSRDVDLVVMVMNRIHCLYWNGNVVADFHPSCGSVKVGFVVWPFLLALRVCVSACSEVKR